MEKLDKVIAGLGCCGSPNCGCACEKCPCDDERDAEKVCLDLMMEDALFWVKEQNRLIRELSDNIPCCDNCEGKTVLGERTDKCVYEIEGFDSVLYCAKRGIENCFGYRRKIEELESKLKESEPVVHAHWIEDDHGCCRNCSACGFRVGDDTSYDLYGDWKITPKRCPDCGAHMDEEVAK